MLNVTHTLERMEITLTSPTRTIQEIGAIITATENVAANAAKFIKSVLSLDVKFEDNDVARVTTLAVAEALVKCKGEVGDEVELYDHAVARAKKHMAANPWMYAKPEGVTRAGMETKAVIEGIDTKVAVRKDGSIGRGGKQILAAELFKKHVTDSTTPCDNACFVRILIKELKMTLPGARTYAHNLRKQAGMVTK